MYYEYNCINCDRYILVNKSMDEASDTEVCPYCSAILHREYSVPQIHMNRMVAEGFMRTDEPPDELKPDQYGGKHRAQIERIPHMVSYPNGSTKRRKGMKD